MSWRSGSFQRSAIERTLRCIGIEGCSYDTISPPLRCLKIDRNDHDDDEAFERLSRGFGRNRSLRERHCHIAWRRDLCSVVWYTASRETMVSHSPLSLAWNGETFPNADDNDCTTALVMAAWPIRSSAPDLYWVLQIFVLEARSWGTRGDPRVDHIGPETGTGRTRVGRDDKVGASSCRSQVLVTRTSTPSFFLPGFSFSVARMMSGSESDRIARSSGARRV